jgi:hypothetical protein
VRTSQAGCLAFFTRLRGREENFRSQGDRSHRQYISKILCRPKIHRHIYKGLLFEPISHPRKSLLVLSYDRHLRLSRCIHHECYLEILGFMKLLVLQEENAYKLWRSSLSNFSPPRYHFVHLRSKYCRHTFFKHSNSAFFCNNIRDQCSMCLHSNIEQNTCYLFLTVPVYFSSHCPVIRQIEIEILSRYMRSCLEKLLLSSPLWTIWCIRDENGSINRLNNKRWGL